MTAFDDYKKRLSAYGSNFVDSTVSSTSEIFDGTFQDSTSYYEVLINGTKTVGVRIVSTNDDNKRVLLFNQGDVQLGDLVEHKTNNWLVTELPFDNKVYEKSKMRLCNNNIIKKVITETQVKTGEQPWGEPIYDTQKTETDKPFPSVVDSKSMDYETGESVILPNNQLQITLPYTTEFKIGDEIFVYEIKYKVKGIDRTKSYTKADNSIYGLLTLNIEVV